MLIALVIALSAPVQTPAAPPPPPAEAEAKTAPPPTAATPTAATPVVDEPPRVYIMDLASDALAPETARGLSSLIAQNMAPDAFNVLTAGDVASVLDLEAEKAALGCDVSSCAAEVASALGTTAVIYGSVVPAGEQLVVQLAFYDAEASRVVGRSSATCSSDAAVLRAAPQLTYDLTAPLLKARGVEVGERPVFTDDVNTTEPTAVEATFGALGYAGVAVAVGGIGGLLGGVVGAAGAYAAAAYSLNDAEQKDDHDAAASIQDTYFDSGFVSVAVYLGLGVAALGLAALAIGIGLAVYDGVTE